MKAAFPNPCSRFSPADSIASAAANVKERAARNNECDIISIREAFPLRRSRARDSVEAGVRRPKANRIRIAIRACDMGARAMRQSAFDFVGNLDTLLAVVVGAMLATIGGLVAEHYEDVIERRRRQRDAARFFGEVLGSIDALVDRAIVSQKYGDPWGPVTMRLFRTAMREAEVYDRNRERLFDIQDTDLRARIHYHVVSEIFPLEAIIEGSERIAEIDEYLDDGGAMSEERRRKLQERLEVWLNSRKTGLDFIKNEREKTPDICRALERLARVSFSKYLPS